MITPPVPAAGTHPWWCVPAVCHAGQGGEHTTPYVDVAAEPTAETQIRARMWGPHAHDGRGGWPAFAELVFTNHAAGDVLFRVDLPPKQAQKLRRFLQSFGMSVRAANQTSREDAYR